MFGLLTLLSMTVTFRKRFGVTPLAVVVGR
jgi:hypothetical protein